MIAMSPPKTSEGSFRQLGVRREQRRQPRRIAARHAAFGADAVDPRMPPGGGKPRRVAAGIVVVDQAEIKLGLRDEASDSFSGAK